ncbi:MAG: hypothetical protein ACC662_06990 [Planctomycetota bacterium]
MRIRTSTLALLLGALLLPACQAGKLSNRGGGAPGERRSGRSTEAFLSDRDLAPVNAYISARNAQWILGDDVDVVASREYFAQYLTLNEPVGRVQRTDKTTIDETTVTVVYPGPKGSVNVTTSPRIMIGTGLTINARRKLVLHLVRTTNPEIPLQLRVTASGDAVRGRKQEVLQRGPMLVLGGEIGREGGRWVWRPIP